MKQGKIMKELVGKLTICRTSSNSEPDTIHIQLEDDTSGTTIVNIKITPEEFALGLTGLGYRPCEFEFADSGLVGTTHEHKTVHIDITNIGWEALQDKDVIESLFQPHEIDGWQGTPRDLQNHHNNRIVGDRTERSVSFRRYTRDGVPVMPRTD